MVEHVSVTRPIGDQAADLDISLIPVHPGKAILVRGIHNKLHMTSHEGIMKNKQAVGLLPHDSCKSTVDLVTADFYRKHFNFQGCGCLSQFFHCYFGWGYLGVPNDRRSRNRRSGFFEEL